MTLVLVRHGVADGNALHRFIGWSEVGLDEIGRAQAEALAERLEQAGVGRVVSSDLRRTMETAEPLARRLGIEVEPDRRLREVDNGGWTGLLPSEVEAGWPDLWRRYVTGEDVERPDGETWATVRARVTEALAELNGSERRTVVVTHAGPIIISAAWALGVTLPGNVFRGRIASPTNGSVTTIEQGPTLIGYADVGHLTALAALDVPYARVDPGPFVDRTTASQSSSSNRPSPSGEA